MTQQTNDPYLAQLDQAINQDLNESLNRVNYQLTSKGYSSLNLDVNHPGTSRVLSVMEDLLLEQESHSRHRLDLQERYRLLEEDNESLTRSTNKFKTKFESSQRQNATQEANLSLSQKELKALGEKVKQLNSETTKLRLSYQQNKVQFQHEVRRKENDLNKNKEKVQKLLNDKIKSGSSMGLTLLNPLPKSSDSLLSKPGSEQEFYNSIVKNYIDREKVWGDELSKIKTHLLNLFQGVRTFIDQELSNNSLKPSELTLLEKHLEADSEEGVAEQSIQGILDRLEELWKRHQSMNQPPPPPTMHDMSTQTESLVVSSPTQTSATNQKLLEKDAQILRLNQDIKKLTQNLNSVQKQADELNMVVTQQKTLIEEHLNNPDDDDFTKGISSPKLTEEIQLLEKKQTELTGRRDEINTLIKKLKDDQSNLNQDREQFEIDKEEWFANQVPKSPIDLMDWLKEKAQFDDDEIAKVISIFTPTTPLSPQSPAPQKLTPRPPSATSQTSNKSSRVGTPTSQHLKSKSEIVTSKSTTPVKSSP
ncbi:hypothetical protein CONCODRAFT_83272 [Conidiobolus coronatus NRRL 28638]|uniref:Uncharacterized protein n=1 Tax=Conidiobolus coronatus (strain ATCC 28846 / CBS 209.66 / NRRL 28638) TaxID=796925 RepID=A0A137PFY3_CONC2|nr:hypothetical protein CONCODRAFT_83272 [Conidiobolus coronatus NRRL 28638]|eukprot:KXN73904.1 hypothetical protein CONCODRAFT_83272 [Conidiobolus coronatus NRRL 28638]